MTAIYNFLVSFKDWILAKIIQVLAWIVDFFTWVFDYGLYWVWKVFDEIIDAGAALIGLIPRPAVFDLVDSSFCEYFSALGGIATGFDLGTPLGIIMAAYVVRFGIRRLPFLG